MSWLVWHLSRLQDDHVAAAFGMPHVSEVTDDDLGRVVDVRWTPHVTLGVRPVV